ncbi:helix-turn-helix domain-containing protein, partial [Streptomyces sp. NPDC056405]|uniref:helix-turn-helix domain-containing protein n=1 Tax=Streptomyces sp. NPDC056405 TaxID=3345811 RepID=UPI0035D5A74B
MFDLPVAVDLRTAARALGIGSTTAYRLIREHEFPCPVLRIGRRYRIPTNELMRALGSRTARCTAWTRKRTRTIRASASDGNHRAAPWHRPRS